MFLKMQTSLNCSLESLESKQLMEEFLVTLDTIHDTPPATTNSGSSKLAPARLIGVAEGDTIPVVTGPNTVTCQVNHTQMFKSVAGMVFSFQQNLKSVLQVHRKTFSKSRPIIKMFSLNAGFNSHGSPNEKLETLIDSKIL